MTTHIEGGTREEKQHGHSEPAFYVVMDDNYQIIGQPSKNYSLAEDMANRWLEDSVGTVFILKSYTKIETTTKKTVSHYK